MTHEKQIFRTQRRVNWCDTDETGNVHFANYVRYMEETEYEFLRSVNLSVVISDEKGVIGFPRLRSQFEIKSPLQFEDIVHVNLTVDDNNGMRIRYRFELFCHARSELTRTPTESACDTDEQVTMKTTRSNGPSTESGSDEKFLSATGQFDVACCRFPPGEPPYAILIPKRIMERIPSTR